MTGGDAFRVRSYQKAAKAIAGFPEDISAADVRGVPGRGRGDRQEDGGVPAARELPAARRPARPGARRGAAADARADAGAEDGDHAVRGARHRLPRRRSARRSRPGGSTGSRGSARRPRRTCSRASSSSSSRAGGCTSASPWTLAEQIMASLPGRAHRLRRVAAADAGHDRRHRHPRRRRPESLMAAFRAQPLRRRGHRGGRQEDVDPHHRRAPGRPAGGARRVVGRGDAVLHRLQGAQRPRSARSRSRRAGSSPSTACSRASG